MAARGLIHPHLARAGLLTATLLLGACKQGGDAYVPPPAYAVGGVLSGLTSGASVSLLLDGIETLKLNANGAFNFHSTLAQGVSYSAIITAQPTGEHCVVSGANGLMPAGAYQGITVTCTTVAGWSLLSGASLVGAAGVYGNAGTAATSNTPGARRRGGPA